MSFGITGKSRTAFRFLFNVFPLVSLNHEFSSKSVLASGIKKKKKFTKYQLKSDLGSLFTSSRIWKLTIFVLCQQYRVWMSSTADQTSKNISEISHCKLSIGFSLSWESMHFRHLASKEYDLFDPLNHVWEGVKKPKKTAHCGLAFKETVTPLFKQTWQARGKGSFCGLEGTEGGEEGKVFLFWFHNTNTWSFHSLLICLFCLLQPGKALLKNIFLHQRWLQ